MNILEIVGRKKQLFENDLKRFNSEINEVVRNNRFLIIGGAGSIGQEVTKQIFSRSAKLLHVVDLSENYLVELVRDLRGELGYTTEHFDTFAVDCGSQHFESFFACGKYDYVLNLSAMKHVRSDNNAFSMHRMLECNLFNTLKTYQYAKRYGSKKYFCVSTDKAANPVNFMGATKRAMEISLMRNSNSLPMSGARFANVAFSNGSLLQGFEYRIRKKQPLSTPSDISRFFVTPEESGIICLFASVLGRENEILFPYNVNEIKLTTFYQIAKNYLSHLGKQAIECYSEHEARDLINSVDLDKYWPVNVFTSDTEGEKPFEEFYTTKEELIYDRFDDLGSVKFESNVTDLEISGFINELSGVDLTNDNARDHLMALMEQFVPSYKPLKTGKFLNSRM